MKSTILGRLEMMALVAGLWTAGKAWAQPPVITAQPTNVTAVAGGSVTLSVGVSGAGPFTYQWCFQGKPAPMNGFITTVAGNAHHGDGEAATNALLHFPVGLALDANGSLFIADIGNNVIRKVGTDGIITTVAGNGFLGYSGHGVAATNAELNVPSGVAVDASGNLFIADSVNAVIRKVGTDGIITTVAGNGFLGYSGNGGAATMAQLRAPHDLAVDASGNLFIADTFNNVIRKVGTGGIITTVAGNGFGAGSGKGGYSGDGGLATHAQLSLPYALALDASGNLFIADTVNNVVRKVGSDGVITTVAGNGFGAGSGEGGYSGDWGAATNARLNYPTGVAVDASGNLFIADDENNVVRKVGTNGIITTVAGQYSAVGGYSGDGGAATNAELYNPSGVAVDASGNLFIADDENNVVRKVGTNGIITTVAGQYSPVGGYSGGGGAATSALFSDPQSLAADVSGNLFIAAPGSMVILKVGTDGIITAVAGNGNPGYPGDGGAATNAELDNPCGVAVDASGDLFIADRDNCVILKVGTDGIIITVAGNGHYGYSGDGGAATNAELNRPSGVAVDAGGNLFIADTFNSVIRKVETNGIITTVAGNGNDGYSGDWGAATSAELDNPSGVAVDAGGNLFIADNYNHVIRKVGSGGLISTVAGNGNPGYSGDGGAATNAQLNYPSGVAADARGNLFIADSYNNVIRKVGTDGIISSVAGNGNYGYSGDGGAAATAELYNPAGLALDASGNLFIADSGNNVTREVFASDLSIASGGSDLVLSNARPADMGGYYVVVSNPSGSVTSLVASVSLTAGQLAGTTLASGAFSLAFSGGVPQSACVILAATNLAPPVIWTPLYTNTADSSGKISFIDVNTTNLAAKYYKVAKP